MFAFGLWRRVPETGQMGLSEYHEIMVIIEGEVEITEEDGTVHNICEGTMCSEDVNYYLGRGLYDNDTHGLFALLFAGIPWPNRPQARPLFRNFSTTEMP